MFYRVGKFKHELGKTDEIMDFFKSKWSNIGALDDLVYNKFYISL